MKLKYISLIVVLLGLGMLSLMLISVARPVSAHNSEHECEHRCITPTPKPTVTPTPTVAVTPTPTPEVCIDCENNPQVTPTPTDVPHVDPPLQPSGPFLAPSCTDGSTILLPANPHVIRQGTTAEVKWFQTQGDQVNIYYKEVGQSGWTHSVADITVVGGFGDVVIGNLNPSLGYTFGIQQKHGCGGGETVTAVVVDGPASKTFSYSYWEWSK